MSEGTAASAPAERPGGAGASARTSASGKILFLLAGAVAGGAMTLAAEHLLWSTATLSSGNGSASRPLPAFARLVQQGARFPAPTTAERAGNPDAAPVATAPGDAGAATSERAPTGGLPSVETMITRLRARLEKAPNDPEGWRMLGWSYASLGRFDKAVKAYREASAHAPDDARIAAALGEALVRAAGGMVTDEAAGVFKRALAIDAKEPRSRYFLGLRKSQRGDVAGAIHDWVAIIEDAPAGADYVGDIRNRIAELSARSGKQAPAAGTGTRPAAPELAAPSQEQVAAAIAMPAEDRQAMIRGMVERLEARLSEHPDDPDGWVRLIRSWTVLGEAAKARAALARAADALADDAAARDRVVAEAAKLGVALR